MSGSNGEHLDLPRLRRRLLAWYDKSRRPMPWRSDPGQLADPYAVLVSETMLQQTQVATVVDYFNRFVMRFPTLEALANAPEQDVLHAWQGLGYYRRARLLHKAARSIVADYGGKVPDTVEQLLTLPGIGRYTAGAVASIAFGRQAPVVDGNVARVLGRVMGFKQPIDSPPSVKRLWEAMERLVAVRTRSRFGPGDVNQAVMELGATVCVPKSPQCGMCPITAMCKAHACGEPERYGVKGSRTKPRAVTHYILAVSRNGRWLFEKRPDTGLWAGMWQLPTLESSTSGKPLSAAAIRRWIETRGLIVGPTRRLASFEHITTHRAIDFQIVTTLTRRGRLCIGAGLWRALDELDDLPMSNAQKRAVEFLRGR